MAVQKRDISDLIKKGAYIETIGLSNDKEKLIIYFGKVKGVFINKLEIEGYKFIPKGPSSSFKIKKGQFTGRVHIDNGVKFLFEKLNYSFFEGKVNVKSGVNLLDKKTFEFYEYLLKSDFSNLLSDYALSTTTDKEKEIIKLKFNKKITKAPPLVKKAIEEYFKIF